MKKRVNIIFCLVIFFISSDALRSDEPTSNGLNNGFNQPKDAYSISNSDFGDFAKSYTAGTISSDLKTECSKSPNYKSRNQSNMEHRMKLASGAQQERESLDYAYEPVTGSKRVTTASNFGTSYGSKYLNSSEGNEIKIDINKNVDDECK